MAAALVTVTGPGLALRWAALIAMVTFLLLSFLGNGADQHEGQRLAGGQPT